MKKDRARVGKKNTQTVSSLEVYNFHWFRRAFLLPLLFMFTDFMLVRRSETYAYFVVFFFSFCPFVHELGTEEGKNETRRNFFCVENVKKLFSSPQLHHSHKSVSRMHFEWYFFSVSLTFDQLRELCWGKFHQLSVFVPACLMCVLLCDNWKFFYDSVCCVRVHCISWQLPPVQKFILLRCDLFLLLKIAVPSQKWTVLDFISWLKFNLIQWNQLDENTKRKRLIN